MAKPTVVINGVVYPTVPFVEIPNSGSSGNSEFYYTADANAAAGDVLSGKTCYSSSGEVTGSMANNGTTGGTISTKSGSYTIPAGYTSGGSVSIAAAAVADLQSSYLLSGKTVLGVSGSLTAATVSQDALTFALSIS